MSPCGGGTDAGDLSRHPGRSRSAGTLPDLPAARQLDERGARFVCWRNESRNGRETKVPLRTDGRNASSTDPATWDTLDGCLEAVPRIAATGIGFVLAAERDAAARVLPIVGVDLDGCRDPATGAIEPWALEVVRDLASYAEVSPSGTGVKVYLFADPVPRLAANKLVIGGANGGGKARQIEVFTTKRYFALTGEHLDGTPEEITDATEAFERLAAWLAREGGDKHGKGAREARVDGAAPSEATTRLLGEHPRLARLWAGEKDRGDTTASGLDISLARELGRCGAAPDEIGRVLSRYPHGQIGGGKLKARAAGRRMGQLLRAAEEARAGTAREDGRSGTSTRVDIRLTSEHWNEVMAECAGLLGDVVYLRGTVPTMLARATEAGGRDVRDEDGAAAVDLGGVRHRPGSLLFVEASPGRVAWHLNERASFLRHVRRGDEWLPTRCPKELAADVVDTAVYLGLRPCAGIAHVPLLAGGALAATPGYHAPSGLILDLRGAPPAVPEPLDEEAARKALERLLRPFRGYLMAGAADPVALGAADPVALAAAALTAVLRPSLPTAPAILVDGNNPAVGKGKLARALGVLNAGAHPAVITEGHSEEETEKRIATAVLQGAPAILFDNLQRHVASSTLESMLTEPVADIRTFGKLSSLRVACRALVLLTANNATLRRDMLRRTLPVRLVVPDERPEIRRFDFCPVEEAARDRAELIAAAFTVVLAWLRARDREENRVHRKPLGSFEAWADLVAGAVSWLTGRNPIDLIEERKDQDPYAADERRVIAALVEEYGDGWWTAGEAAEAIAPDVWAGAIRLKGDRPGARDVAYWLRKRKDRVFDGRMLVNEPDRKGVARWSLPGMPGMAGDDSPSRARNGTGGVGGAKSRDGGANIPGDPRHPRHPPGPRDAPVSGPEGNEQAGDDAEARRSGHPEPGGGCSERPFRTGPGERPCSRVAKVEYRLVTDADEARRAVAGLAGRGDLVGLNLKTTGLDPLTAEVRLLQLAPADGPVVVIDLFRAGGLAAVRDPLEGLRAVAHNATFDVGFLRRAGLRLTPDCTLLAGHVLTGRREGLAAFAEHHLGLRLDKSGQRSDWSGELGEDQLRYAALNAHAVRRLHHALQAELAERGGVRAHELARDAQPAVVAMHLAGMPFDAAAGRELEARLTAERDRLRSGLEEALAGRNPNSGEQLAAWLAGLLGGAGSRAYRAWPKTGKGRLATGADDLRRGASLLPADEARVVTGLLLPFKLVEKRLSTYGAGLAGHVHPLTGRIHARFNLAGTVTGRMSSSDPNMQNIPRDPTFRGLFRAPEGRALAIADYAQIELRVAALLAGEGRLLEAFREDRDTHALTAATLLGKRPEDVTKAERQLAKAVNFGLLYGQGARGLQTYAANSYGVEITEADARRHREAWFAAYPAFARWHCRSGNAARRELVVRTPAGRVRRWDTADRKAPGGFRETEAYNTPVQGGAAEAMLAALARVERGLGAAGLDAVLVAVVHDELIVEAAEADAAVAARVLEEGMTAGMLDVFPEASVKGLVEARVGSSWADK